MRINPNLRKSTGSLSGTPFWGIASALWREAVWLPKSAGPDGAYRLARGMHVGGMDLYLNTAGQPLVTNVVSAPLQRHHESDSSAISQSTV